MRHHAFTPRFAGAVGIAVGIISTVYKYTHKHKYKDKYKYVCRALPLSTLLYKAHEYAGPP